MSILERCFRWAILLPVPAMVFEMATPPTGAALPLKLILLLAPLSLLAGSMLQVSTGWLAHVAMFAYFVLIALVQPVWAPGGIGLVDMLNGLQILLFAPILAGYLSSRDRWEWWSLHLARILVVLCALVAVAGLFKFFLLSQGIFIASLTVGGEYPRGTSLRVDYNVYSLAVCTGLAAALWLRERTAENGAWRTIAAAAVLVMIPAVALSGSRRGAVFLVVTIVLSFFVGRSVTAGRRRWILPVATLGTVVVLFAILLFRLKAGEATLLFSVLDVGSATSRVTSTAASGGLADTRLPLLLDAVESLRSRYTPGEIVFGRGFGFMNEMGRQFARESGQDYPHNFILSALLHGGVLLTSMMLVLVWKAMRAGWERREELGWFVTVTFLGFAFVMSSAASLYSVKLFLFLLVIVPLLITRHAEWGPTGAPQTGPA